MRRPFIKMHGLGNDFVILDARQGGLSMSGARAAALADRRRGIGCDQLIMIAPAEGADAAMLIRNPDGSHSSVCGNATRCVAWLLAQETGRSAITLRTGAGILTAECLPDGQVRVDMGPPGLGWRDVPLAREQDTLRIEPLEGTPAAVSMGNPHLTFFVEGLARIDVSREGPRFECDPLLPERANVGFAQITGAASLRLRVWERGAGLTLACGSGACAALVNAHRRGLLPREADVELDGGTLRIVWREADGHVLMTGPVATAFDGQVDLASYPP
jgi:diaminopimelate epimerase